MQKALASQPRNTVKKKKKKRKRKRRRKEKEEEKKKGNYKVIVVNAQIQTNNLIDVI